MKKPLRVSGSNVRACTVCWLMIALATMTIGPGAARAQRPPLSGAAQAGPRPVLGDVIQRAERSVVRITVRTKDGEDLGFGSGFLVDPQGLVATNHHVVRRAGKAFVQFKDGRKVAVKGIRAQDEKADLAILELEAMPEPVPALSLGPPRPPRPGDAVVAIGHPRGLRFSSSAGIVAPSVRARTSRSGRSRPATSGAGSRPPRWWPAGAAAAR